MHTKPRKQKSRPRPKLWSSKRADAEFSKWIRARDGKCQRCGKTEYLQNSHFWPRSISAVRYDPKNCIALCYGCHYGDRINGWEYSKHAEYRDFMLQWLGESEYALLAKRARSRVQRSDAIKKCMELVTQPPIVKSGNYRFS